MFVRQGELHRDTEELLMCLEGSVEIHILNPVVIGGALEDDVTVVPLTAGELTVVPRGHCQPLQPALVCAAVS